MLARSLITSAIPRRPGRCRCRAGLTTRLPSSAFTRGFFGHGHSHGGHGHSHGGGQGHSHGGGHDFDTSTSDGQRQQRITYIGMGTNCVLAGSKFGVGIFAGSASLVADAAHSFSDMVSDVVTIVAIRQSKKEADDAHPYGYGRYETVGTLSVATLLVVASLGIGEHSLHALLDVMSSTAADSPSARPQLGDHIPVAMAAAVVSLGVKEWLFQATKTIGEETNSSVLLANAWHHRADALSSLIAVGGILGCALGAPLVDPIGGLLVAGMVLKMGAGIGSQAVKELADSSDEATTVAVRRQIQDITDGLIARQGEGEGVGGGEGDGHHQTKGDLRDVHNVRLRRMGPYYVADCHARVNPRLSVSAAHQVGVRVRRAIMDVLPQVKDVLVHVDADEIPDDAYVVARAHDDRGHAHGHGEVAPQQQVTMMRPQSELEMDIRRAVAPVAGIRGIAHVLCHFLEGRTSVALEIEVDDDMTVRHAREIAQEAKGRIMKIEDIAEADVHLELFGPVPACDVLLEEL